MLKDSFHFEHKWTQIIVWNLKLVERGNISRCTDTVYDWTYTLIYNKSSVPSRKQHTAKSVHDLSTVALETGELILLQYKSWWNKHEGLPQDTWNRRRQQHLFDRHTHTHTYTHILTGTEMKRQLQLLIKLPANLLLQHNWLKYLSL